MKVLFLAAEASPFSKVGGLGDVAGELPRWLRRLDLDVRTVLPLHAATDTTGVVVDRALSLAVPRRGGEIQARLMLSSAGDLPLWFIDAEAIRSAGSIYAHPATDGDKFTLFSRAALLACEATGWIPDVVHAHDWHTALSVVWARQMRAAASDWAGTRTVLTIHNLPYMGAGAESAVEAYDVPAPDLALLPPWAHRLPLPLGLAAADGLTTVSPTYAQEIRTAEFGCGLESLLIERGDRLQGITNGIDPEVWNPASDAALAQTFTPDSLDGRRNNKRDLQRRTGLPQAPDVPLLAMVTRLDRQKGVDLALAALERLLDIDWQFVLLGTGEDTLEAAARALAAAHPDRVRAVQRYDPMLSRRVFAGSDMLVIPSRYEPCGLTQMIGMRYGSIPIVRATGGLRDTVAPYAPAEGTGFVFHPAESGELESATRQAIDVYRDPQAWRSLQRRAMAEDHSWERSAGAYADFYRRLASA